MMADRFSYHKRMGQNNKIIKILKFRSMSVNDDKLAEKGKEQKITRFGGS